MLTRRRRGLFLYTLFMIPVAIIGALLTRR